MASKNYPKGFRIEYNSARPNQPYRVVRPVDGKLVRTSFRTEKEAKESLEKAVKLYLKHGAPAVQWDAGAHAEWKEAKRILEGQKVTLPEIAAFWLRHGKRDCPRLPVPEAVAAFLEDKGKQGRSDRHTGDLRRRLSYFAAAHAKKTVEEIDTEVALKWLKSKGGEPRSMRNNLSVLMNFLNYAKRRGWTDAVPDIHPSDLPAVKATSKGVLTVAEARGMFEWVRKNRERWCAWFALQSFAGVRHAEAERFRWEWVDFERRRVTIPKEICKTGDDWVLVGLPDNLWAWLEKYRQPEGKMARPGDRALDVVRKHLVTAKIITEWPKNALRHGFATYHISLHESADKTALLTRHQSATMLWKSYLRCLVDKSEAEGYFSIKPAATA